MEYFVISAKFVPLKYYTPGLYTLIATAASNLVFSWVVRVGEFCHLELPGNAKIVYTCELVSSDLQNKPSPSRRTLAECKLRFIRSHAQALAELSSWSI